MAQYLCTGSAKPSGMPSGLRLPSGWPLTPSPVALKQAPLFPCGSVIGAPKLFVGKLNVMSPEGIKGFPASADGTQPAGSTPAMKLLPVGLLGSGTVLPVKPTPWG